MKGGPAFHVAGSGGHAKVAIGANEGLRDVAQRLRGWKFGVAVHPSASVDPSALGQA